MRCRACGPDEGYRQKNASYYVELYLVFTGGFISKWYLAIGSLETGLFVVSWLGPVVLLISALLTAGYLLPIAIDGFFPGPDFDYERLEKKDPTKQMLVPIMLLAAMALLFGMFPNYFISYMGNLAEMIF